MEKLYKSFIFQFRLDNKNIQLTVTHQEFTTPPQINLVINGNESNFILAHTEEIEVVKKNSNRANES